MKKSEVKIGMKVEGQRSAFTCKKQAGPAWEKMTVVEPVVDETDMFWLTIHRPGKPTIKGIRYASELRLPVRKE